MDADELGFVLFFLGCVLAVPAAVLGYLMATDDGALARFNATPPQLIRDVRPDDGKPVKIVGEARASEKGEKLVGPFTGREVLFHRIVVMETERYLDGTTLRERVTRHLFESSVAPVRVRDESGEARVVVDGEENFGALAVETIDVGGRPLPKRVQEALDARGVATRNASGERKRLVCTEAVILPGDPVIVIGPARRVTPETADASGRRDARTELVVGERSSSGQKRMFVLTNRGESSLGAGDRKFRMWAWGLIGSSSVMIVSGAWLLWG